MTARPYWLAAGTMAWGAIVLWKAQELPQFDQYAFIGPGFLPSMIGAVLILLGVILGIQIAQGVEFEEQGAEDLNEDHSVSYKSLGLAAAGCALPMLTMKPLGFVLTCTVAFALIAAAFQSRRWAMNLVIGLIVSVVAYWLFGLLGVQLGGWLPAMGY